MKSTAGAIGYVEESYADDAGLPTAQIKNANGEYVKASTDAASKGLSTATVADGNDLKVTFDYTTKVAGHTDLPDLLRNRLHRGPGPGEGRPGEVLPHLRHLRRGPVLDRRPGLLPAALDAGHQGPRRHRDPPYTESSGSLTGAGPYRVDGCPSGRGRGVLTPAAARHIGRPWPTARVDQAAQRGRSHHLPDRPGRPRGTRGDDGLDPVNSAEDGSIQPS